MKRWFRHGFQQPVLDENGKQRKTRDGRAMWKTLFFWTWSTAESSRGQAQQQANQTF